MATIPARAIGYQVVSYLRAPIDFSIGNSGIVQVGTLPGGSIVLRGYVIVTTAFNATTTNTMKIGTVASDASYGTGIALGTAGVITSGTALATATTACPTVDTSVIATSVSTGAVATAGAGYVIVEYLPVA
jgi:hypothetical protein